MNLIQFSSVQSLSRVRLFATPWIAAHQASLSITISRSSLRLMSVESVMPSSHLILCHPLLLLPPIPPSISVFSNESTLRMRWPKYWSFSFSMIPSKEIPGLISFRMGWLDLLAVQGTLESLLPKKIKSLTVHVFPIYLPWSDETVCHDLSFLNVEFKAAFSPAFSLSSLLPSRGSLVLYFLPLGCCRIHIWDFHSR